MNLLKVLYDWLKDVYKRYGYVAVLVCLVVVVALCVAVMLLFGVTPAQMVKFVWGIN